VKKMPVCDSKIIKTISRREHGELWCD